MNQITMVLNTRNDIRYYPKAALQYFSPIFQYWRCSLPGRYADIAKELDTLVSRGTAEEQHIVDAVGCGDLVRPSGFIEVYRKKSFSDVQEAAQTKRKQNMVLDAISAEELRKMEPDLSHEFSSGLHFKDTLLVRDPGALVNAYIDHVLQNGGHMVKSHVNELKPPSTASADWKLTTGAGEFQSPHVVICSGPWTDVLLKPLGYKLPLYPLRGYCAHFQLREGAALNYPVEDFENGFFMGPMRQGVRITTGGEFTTMDSKPNEKQIRRAEEVLRSILPVQKAVGGVWYGHRPCVGDMKPIIGESKHEGLWFNFGHAHSGLTLGAITARVLAELLAGEKTVVDPKPFSMNRF
ncbi:FAD dependent oxidoreductase, putative [Angomonas deanei]|uniref:FAD dependent oxidoreductase, putative n=1 Tax=Angomonas deanei TaxID=59799 RepID=A0A7G2CV58_9TRYP|nr:FAD dependent oxidoreductase, putative [Angomonas deanei]